MISYSGGADYQRVLQQQILFNSVNEMCVSIQILDDVFYEGEESFSVQLTSPNAGIFRVQATVFIMDNEPRTLFSQDCLSICLWLNGEGRKMTQQILKFLYCTQWWHVAECLCEMLQQLRRGRWADLGAKTLSLSGQL